LLVVVGTAAFGAVMRSAERTVIVVEIEVEMMNLQAQMRRCSAVGHHLHVLDMSHDLFLNHD
jgi:hypothetical protein